MLMKKEFLIYLVTGVITIVVNFGCYFLVYEVCGASNVLSVILSWLVSVAVAFFANKVYVFNSKNFTVGFLMREIFMFSVSRMLTGLSELVIMYIAVDVLKFNAIVCKIFTNIFVIVVNYISGKLLVFRDER